MTTTGWMKALKGQRLDVRSARDALQVKGWLDAGNYALNWAISARLQRGWPLGHTAEVFGDPGTGKSFLVARAMSMAQAAGGVALLDDTEGAYSVEYQERLGINVEQLAVVNSGTVKQHLAAARAFLTAFRESRQKGPGILVCDSLAQLSTEHELDTQLERRDMSKAAEMKAFFRIVSGDLLRLPVTYIGTNHVIANIGNPWQPRTTGGGGGSKYASSVRLDLRAVSKIKRKNDDKDADAEYVGVVCTVFVDKNRFVPPWKKIKLAIPFERPIARHSGLVPLLVLLGVLKERGQFLYCGSKRIGRAYASKKDRFLDQDETGAQLLELCPSILDETDEQLGAGKLGGAAAAASAAVAEVDEAAEPAPEEVEEVED